ncbi:[FeFe] hydrogenase H-cluster radical SAM maturase HydG [Geothrix sp. PMB-07]|uniref:[FeFe] hydrogenase H-cluster radical SAM maturase HydG n=1 Tax=Geothrix sp. PMB-07 TaxID=3068640 RepID=UPI002740E87C|nr:[FeFe] hydrogenase H-cluster radical SAM maturase HydG [Geothrix sp. PMB-07]WLT30708.1 [FeFe] hydrogenase H-cluster radical SAM maturase HydG [Geothrix sp. PMB-07]
MRGPSESFPLDEASIHSALAAAPKDDPVRVREILAKAREMKGLADQDLPPLMAAQDPALLQEIFNTARWVKDQIYGNRIVMFAPLYVSNLCANECLYCAFRASNRELKRRALTQAEIAAEVDCLLSQGHKRLVLVAGEAYPKEGLDYILSAIRTVYSVRRGDENIRRVNVNIAPLDVPDFKRLKDTEIGTYQLFQETYHRETYAQMHQRGVKADFDWRLGCMDRAMQAGIDDVGIGALFGLYDWRFELLATLHHARHLEDRFGCGPHTISVPRIEPAEGSETSEHPPHAVKDEDFWKLIAILRLAVPYTGLILSTRERPEVRSIALQLGISQISAGSRTNPGGYEEDIEGGAQFSLGDHRSLDEVVRDLAETGFIPSFCTSCYRMGRTGVDFMDLAKPGEIKAHCHPNALSTLQEFVEDHASPETRLAAERLIAADLAQLDPRIRAQSERMVAQVKEGARDVFC